MAQAVSGAHVRAAADGAVLFTPVLITDAFTPQYTPGPAEISFALTVARAVTRAGNESAVVAAERRLASANPVQLALTVARAVPGARRHVFGGGGGGAKRTVSTGTQRQGKTSPQHTAVNLPGEQRGNEPALKPALQCPQNVPVTFSSHTQVPFWHMPAALQLSLQAPVGCIAIH